MLKNPFIFILILLIFFSCSSQNKIYLKKKSGGLYDINYSYNNINYSENEITLSFHDSPDSYNPYFANSQTELFLRNALFTTLFTLNPETGLPEKNAANSYEIKNDAKEYTITLKDNIRFTNDQPLDANDAAASLSLINSFLKESVFYKGIFLNNNSFSVEAIDASTLSIKIDTPNINLLFVLSSFPIIPKDKIKNFKENKEFFNSFWKEPAAMNSCASGPFIIKNINEDLITLEKNNNYFKLDKSGKRLPLSKKINLKIYPSRNKEIIGFSNNESDMISVENEDYANLSKYYSFKKNINFIYTKNKPEKTYIAFNVQKKESKNFMNDTEFRKYLAKNIFNDIIGKIKSNDINDIIDYKQVRDYSFKKQNFIRTKSGKSFYKDGSEIFIRIIAPEENESLSNIAKITGKTLSSMKIPNKVEIISSADFFEKLFYKHDYEIAFFNYQTGPDLTHFYNLIKDQEFGFFGQPDSDESRKMSEKLNELLDMNNLNDYKNKFYGIEKLFYPACRILPIYTEKKIYLMQKNILNLKINTNTENCYNLKSIEYMIKK